jgi:hypothetical protein
VKSRFKKIVHKNRRKILVEREETSGRRVLVKQRVMGEYDKSTLHTL